jgi:hypothetical protein
MVRKKRSQNARGAGMSREMRLKGKLFTIKAQFLTLTDLEFKIDKADQHISTIEFQSTSGCYIMVNPSKQSGDLFSTAEYLRCSLTCITCPYTPAINDTGMYQYLLSLPHRVGIGYLL